MLKPQDIMIGDWLLADGKVYETKKKFLEALKDFDPSKK